MNNNLQKGLSVIIISYNTERLTLDCLKSLNYALSRDQKLKSEIIVVDNASVDTSTSSIKSYIKRSQVPIYLISNKKNIGFGAANNQGVKRAKYSYTLLLNSDTLIENVNFSSLIEYIELNQDVGLLTVKVRFPHGAIDPASHRGFPTIWRSFCFFSGLERLTAQTPLNRIFGGYHLTHMNLSHIHEIDCPAGAFFLMPTALYKTLHGFDTNFFMYGEDIDLAYRIKERDLKVIYYPEFVILHLKHQSGLKSTKETQTKTRYHFYNAMKIFYKKHYAKNYPNFVNSLIYFLIDLKAKL